MPLALADYEPYVALAILAAMFVMFVWERFPTEVTAVGGAALYIVLGFVNPDRVMDVFSNPAPITIAAMFVISGALVRTGLLDALAQAIVKRARRRPSLALGVFLFGAMFASAFVNNTPVVLILIPVVIRLAGAIGAAPTRLLIPLSFVSILGGACTLIGTSTNLLVDGVARNLGVEPFSIFEIAPVGLVAVATGCAALAILGPLLLPDRGGARPGRAIAAQETEYLSEVTLLEGDEGLGAPLGEVAALSHVGLKVIGRREGERIVRRDLKAHVLAEGDTLIVVAALSELLTLRETPTLRVGLSPAQAPRDTDEMLIAEAMVTPKRSQSGVTIGRLGLGRRYGLRVLGAHRHGHIAGPDLADVRLRPADSLLMEGPTSAFDALGQEGEFVSITRPTGRAFRRRRAPLALIALAAVVGLAAMGVMQIGVLAMIAVAALLLSRCIDSDEAWGSIDGAILVLIFAMLIVGAALQQTGAVDLIVAATLPLVTDAAPIWALAGVFALTAVLTQLATNNAVAVVLTPIAFDIAEQIGADPRAFVVAVMFGASASFATPIGYQTNTLVYGAGAYRFSDFLKIGVPLNLIVGAAAVAAIAWFFPL